MRITKKSLRKIIRENVLLEQDKMTVTVGPPPGFEDDNTNNQQVFDKILDNKQSAR